MSLTRELDLILKGGRVERFHTLSVLKRESVAEHSFLVAWVCYLVWGPTIPATLLLAALSHDLPEYLLGDMPSPSKKRLGVGPQFRQEEGTILDAAGMYRYEEDLDAVGAEILKFADNFAGYLKCLHEQALGNRLIDQTAGRYRAYIMGILDKAEHLSRETCLDLMHIIEGESDVS